MASNNQNPWADQDSQHPPPPAPQTRYYQASDPYTDHPSQAQHSTPWSQEPSQGLPPHQQGLPPHQQAPRPSYPGRDEDVPSLPPRRTATDIALPQGQDRTHQIEVMQSYEAAGRKDDDDDNVQTLQREFPKLDGSLIAAIYGDSKSLSATREMLQALGEE